MQIQTKIIDDLKLSLTDLERESFEGLISTDELFVALKGLQNGKAPGFDDLPAEFYLFFFFFFFYFSLHTEKTKKQKNKKQKQKKAT